MAFTQQQNVTITGRGGVTLVLYIPDPDKLEDVQYGEANVQIKISDGTIKEAHYDLLLRLTDDAPGLGHLSNLNSLKSYILARIDNEVLP